MEQPRPSSTNIGEVFKKQVEINKGAVTQITKAELLQERNNQGSIPWVEAGVRFQDLE